MRMTLLFLCVFAALTVSARDAERVRVNGMKNAEVVYHPFSEIPDGETEYFQKAVPADDGFFLLPDDGKTYRVIVMAEGGEENGYPIFYLLPGENAVVTGSFREPGWFDYTIAGPAAYDEMMKHRMLSPQIREGKYAQMLRIKCNEFKKNQNRPATEGKQVAGRAL